MADTSILQSASMSSIAAESSGQFRELLHYYSAVLQRGWRLIAIAIVACLTLAAIYLATTTRMYEAKTRLLVLQSGGRPINLASNDTNAGQDRSDDYIPTHALILSSPLVINHAIETVGLKNLPTLEAAKRKGFDPAEDVLERLRVERPDRLAKILTVTYRAWSREEAIRMVNAIIASYHRFVEESFETKSNEAIKLIAKARDELSTELDELQKNYREFRQKNKSLLTGEDGRSFASIQLEQLHRAANEAKLKAMQLKSQLEMGKQLSKSGAGLWSIAHAMEQLGGAPTSPVLANTAVTSQGASLDYLRQLCEEQQRLVERFGPTTPEFRRSRTRSTAPSARPARFAAAWNGPRPPTC